MRDLGMGLSIQRGKHRQRARPWTRAPRAAPPVGVAPTSAPPGSPQSPAATPNRMSGECEQFARPMHGAKYPKEANTDKEHDLGLERQELRRQEGSRQDAPQELRREAVHHRPVRQGSVNSLRGLCMGLSIKMRQTPTKSTNLVGSDIILTKSTNLVGSNIILFIMLGSGRLKQHTYFCNFCSGRPTAPSGFRFVPPLLGILILIMFLFVFLL